MSDNLDDKNGMEEGIVFGKESKTPFSMKLTEEDREGLEKIKEYYRSPSITHAIRLMIVDVVELIQQDKYV